MSISIEMANKLRGTCHCNDKLHYYDPNSGARTENTTLTIEGKTYHFDAEGNGKLLN